MAKILPGALVGSISGSLGEVTFLRTRHGQVAQTRPVRKTPATAADLRQRQNLRVGMAFAVNWRTILFGDYIAWYQHRRETWSQAWVAAWCRYANGQPFNHPYVDDVANQATPTLIEQAPNSIAIHVTWQHIASQHQLHLTAIQFPPGGGVLYHVADYGVIQPTYQISFVSPLRPIYVAIQPWREPVLNQRVYGPIAPIYEL